MNGDLQERVDRADGIAMWAQKRPSCIEGVPPIFKKSANFPLEGYSDWIYNRSINFSVVGSVPNSVINALLKGTYIALDQLNLRFEVTEVTLPPDILEVFESHYNDGKVRGSDLAKGIRNLPRRVENMSADIIVFKGGFLEDPLWSGRSHARDASVLIGLQDFNIGDLEKLTYLQIHEMAHLLGGAFHHEDFFKEDVSLKGVLCPCYGAELKSMRVDRYCPHCMKSLNYVWDGVEKRTGVIFRG